MTFRLTVVSDAICPWCWIGKRRLDTALATLRESDPELAFEVAFFPFMLNPDMPDEGVDRTSYRTAKFGSLESARARDAEVTAVGRDVGLEFRLDAIARTPNTTNAHRLSLFAAAVGVQVPVMEGIFRAYFNEGRDIGDVSVLADIGAEAGMDRGAVAERLAGTEARDQVRGEAEAVSRAGIHGVPTFVLNRHILFSGAQAPETIAEALRTAARHPAILAAAE
jgi:predicted DsbA family dithiol-disulfide isomerase